MGKLKTVSHDTREILTQLNKDYKPPEKTKEPEKAKLDKFNAVRYNI